MSYNLKLSVHQLVDSLLRTGDIDNRIFNNKAMQEGTRIHAEFQKKQGSKYISEYPLYCTEILDDFKIEINGKADGVIISESMTTIEEIKSCVCDISEFHDNNFAWHNGQALVYAYMYAKLQNLSFMGVKVTYISQKDSSITENYFNTYAFDELKEFYFDLLKRFIDFHKNIINHKIILKKSIKDLAFPFPSFRKHQIDYMNEVYNNINDKEKTIIEAPTGIGKTMSSIFPNVKSFSNNLNKLVFLTAKTSGKEAAEKAFDLLIENGYKGKTTVITAKEKACPYNEIICDPAHCPLTINYFSKIREILLQEINSERYLYDSDTIQHLSKHHLVCPFELSLDLSTYSDAVIMDYNYVFDPFSYLQRLIENDCSDVSLLVDEAHNLVNRGRSMYSSKVSLSNYIEAKKTIKPKTGVSLKKSITKIISFFKEQDKFSENGEYELVEFDRKLIMLITKFNNEFLEYSSESPELVKSKLKDIYFSSLSFIKLMEKLDEKPDNFLLSFEKSNDDMTYSLFCIDASPFLKARTEIFRNSLFFSATFTPIEYFEQVIFGSKKIKYVTFDYPFDENRLCLTMNTDISLKYKNRDTSFVLLEKYIDSILKVKRGNFMIFAPSFQYIKKLKESYLSDKYNFIFQYSGMREAERKEYIEYLDDQSKTNVICAVLGGSFGESIDLQGEKLIGSIILGVGHPSISLENEAIRKYYDKNGMKKGYEYAYNFPGMNNVTQAIGRVIRTEDDYGIAVLIDERFSYSSYKKLFRKEWNHYKIINSSEYIEKYLTLFYKSIGKLWYNFKYV